MGEFVLTAFHGLYEVIRQFWWVFFLGWWAFWWVKAHKTQSREPLLIPAAMTAIGLVVAVVSTIQVYGSVNDPWFSVQLDPCSSWDHPDEQADCYADDERAVAHFRSLAVFTEPASYNADGDRDIHLLKTYWNVFADTVSFVQIVTLWLIIPYLFFRRRKSGPKKEKRDIIRV